MIHNVVDRSIPLCVPEFSGSEWTYVKECLDSGWVSTSGPLVSRFEEAVAKIVGAKHAVATMTGTSALHVSLLVAGVQPDDEVLVSTLTFIAPVNTIRYVGAWPVFIDAEPRFWQMDPERVIQFLERSCSWRSGALYNKKSGRRISAILPVHILGHPVDIDPVVEIAQKYNVRVIEDATEALGARYKGAMAGRLADIASFSFNGNKIVTAGSGGMIVTDNPEWAAKARYLTTQAKDDAFEFVHREIGYNYRMTSLQAALGLAQVEQLDRKVRSKRGIFAGYLSQLADEPGIHFQPEASWAGSTRWMSSMYVQPEVHGKTARDLMKALAEQHIETRPLWQPIHLSRAHANGAEYSCPVAEDLNRCVVNLPCSAGMSDESQQAVIASVRTALHSKH